MLIPRRGIVLPRKRLFPNYRRLEEAYRNGRALITVVSDSGGLGQGTAGGGSGLTGAYNTSWVAQLCGLLSRFNAYQGSVSLGGHGGESAGLDDYYPTPRTYASGWSFGTGLQTPWGSALTTATATGPVAIALPDVFDAFEYLNWTFPGNGTYTISDGATLLDTVNANGADAQHLATYKMPLGTHTLNFTRTAGAIALSSGRVYNSNMQHLQIENASVSGRAINTVINDTTYSANFLNIIPYLGHLVVLQGGGNDKLVGGRTPTQIENDIVTAGAAVLNAGKDFMIGIPAPCNPASGLGDGDMDVAYLPAFYRAATRLGIPPPVDLHGMFVSWAAANAKSYYFDDFHPNRQGAFLSALEYERRLTGST